MTIQVTNHGPLITSTNYWSSEYARAGKIFCSVNAGAIRVLLPPQHYPSLIDMRASRYCVLSRGPWTTTITPDQQQAMQLPRSVQTVVVDGVEILWEDGSDSPFCLHLSPESFDLLPGEPEPNREWLCTTWTQKDGKPHLALQRICHWRRVAQIPWLKPWKGNSPC